jgi:hypothetical protein
MDILPPLDDKLLSLFGRRDKIIPIFTKWPLYELDFHDHRGFWAFFADKIYDLDEKKKILTPTEEEIDDYLYKNSDIEFELFFSKKLVYKNFVFKLNDKIYLYVIGRKSKRSKKLHYVRFFFDFKDIFTY